MTVGNLNRVIISLILAVSIAFSEVIELDESFLDVDNGSWLINFYAPWCGYCRRLSPIYEEVSHVLHSIVPSLKVARIDASKFSSVGKKYNVNGFPTIKYINGQISFTHDGDRSVRSLLSFAVRSHGPAVKTFQTDEELLHNLTFFGSDPYFVLIDRPQSAFKDVFFDTAERLRLFGWFLFLPPNLLYPHLLQSIPSDSDVIVFKDGGSLFYPNTRDKNNLPQWILHERHPMYPYFTTATLWEFGMSELSVSAALSQTHSNADMPSRILALILVEDSNALDEKSASLVELGRSLAKRRLEQDLSPFQFGWTDAHKFLTEWAIVDIVTPNIVVFDWPRRILYLYQENGTVISDPEPESVVSFLRATREGKVTAYGGNGVFSRLRRFQLKFSSEFINFASHHPLITLLLCGLPATIISAIFYLCFCLDDQYVDSPTSGEEDALMDNSTDTGDALSHIPISTSRKRSSRHFVDTGPVESKESVEAKHLTYEEWKKNL